MASETEVNPDDLDLERLVGRNYVTVKQAAQLLGRAYRTVRAWIHVDPKDPDKPPKLKAIRVGGEYRIYEDELKRFLQEGNN